MQLSIAIALGQQEDDLLAREVLLFESCFSTVNVFDYVALLELPFEGLQHFGAYRPILITNYSIRDLSLLDANVRDDGNSFVIAS